MDYQARLNDILEKVRKGGVYDVMPEYERQSDYLDTDEAQEVITALFLESIEILPTVIATAPRVVVDNNKYVDMVYCIDAMHKMASKWQTNQEDGE